MKKLKLFLMTVIALSFAACGNGGKINPTSKNVNGPLGKFFEVVERDYKINDGELSVEFKRVSEGGPTDASWSSEPTFSVELLDEDGNSIASEHSNIVSNKEQLEAVFSLGVDETSSIQFKFGKTEGGVKFKVSSKWEADDNTRIGQQRNGDNDKEGDLEANPYKWLSERLATEEDLVGKNLSDLRIMRNTIFAMHGYIFKTSDMKEHFGNLSWYKGTKNDVSSELSSIESKNVQFIKEHESNATLSGDDSSDYNTTSSSSEDWDALLNTYEKYVDKYISYAKKAAKGDVTALAEYPSLMEKAQDLSSKLQNAHGNMSSAQWARYNKITLKMANAAKEMQ